MFIGSINRYMRCVVQKAAAQLRGLVQDPQQRAGAVLGIGGGDARRAAADKHAGEIPGRRTRRPPGWKVGIWRLLPTPPPGMCVRAMSDRRPGTAYDSGCLATNSERPLLTWSVAFLAGSSRPL